LNFKNHSNLFELGQISSQIFKIFIPIQFVHLSPHLLPPGLAQSVHRYLSVFSTTELVRFGRLSLTGGPTLSMSPGSSSELVRFRYLSIFSTSKLVRSGRFTRRPPRALDPAHPLGPADRTPVVPCRLPPPIRKSVKNQKATFTFFFPEQLQPPPPSTGVAAAPMPPANPFA
jgi:hypothetical protein